MITTMHPRRAEPAPVARTISPLDAILENSQASRALVQGFCALAKSLEWELGQEYLRARGNRSFLGDFRPVPWYVNNDSTLSRNAAEVLFEGLEARGEAEGRAERGEGREEETIYVLELGVGVGLFARFFLDHFRELCRKSGRDYYDRLCYIAADRSERMLRDMCRHGVLAEHAGHYRLRLVDALDPASVAKDIAFSCRTDCESVRVAGEDGLTSGKADGLTIRPTASRARPFAAVFLGSSGNRASSP